MKPLLAILILGLSQSPIRAQAEAPLRTKPNWSTIERTLKSKSFPPRFIKDFKKVYDPQDFAEVVSLNVLIYLKKDDYHGPQVDDQATEDVKNFLKEHSAAFRKAEKRDGVDRHVVASLLWMESRFGENKGSFHVPSAFGHLLHLNNKTLQKELLLAAKEYGPVTQKIRREIKERSRKKSKWALGELRAIAQIHKRHRKVLENWTGSFSGAYGLPQFLPSSELAYAKSIDGKSKPDLYHPKDAISSVSFYLKKSGWRKRRPKSHERALLKYNKSRDYARAILKLANMSK